MVTPVLLERNPRAPHARHPCATWDYSPPIVASAMIAQERTAMRSQIPWSRDVVKSMPGASPPERLRAT